MPTAYFKLPCQMYKARILLERKLGLVFQMRDSSYWGGTYFLSQSQNSDEEWKIIRNKDVYDRELILNCPAKTILIVTKPMNFFASTIARLELLGFILIESV